MEKIKKGENDELNEKQTPGACFFLFSLTRARLRAPEIVKRKKSFRQAGKAGGKQQGIWSEGSYLIMEKVYMIHPLLQFSSCNGFR